MLCMLIDVLALLVVLKFVAQIFLRYAIGHEVGPSVSFVRVGNVMVDTIILMRFEEIQRGSTHNKTNGMILVFRFYIAQMFCV